MRSTDTSRNKTTLRRTTSGGNVAMSPERRDTRIVTGNDVVHATFKFIECAGMHTIHEGISPIGLESPDPDLLRKQIHCVPGEGCPAKYRKVGAACGWIRKGRKVPCPIPFVFRVERDHTLVLEDFFKQDIAYNSPERSWILCRAGCGILVFSPTAIARISPAVP